MISPVKLRILTPLQKLPPNVRDLGRIIVDKGFEKLPKVQQIAQSGHTARNCCLLSPDFSIGKANINLHLVGPSIGPQTFVSLLTGAVEKIDLKSI